MEVEFMDERNPVEFTGSVLDQRNDLTGPDDKSKAGYPKMPKNRIPIQQQRNGK
jgi:hypothetical protein